MKEEKYIQSLFEQARHEEPQLSYEKVAHDLDVAINPGKVAILRDWFFNHIYLNTFIAILTVFVLSGFMFLHSQTNETKVVATSFLEHKSQTPTQDKSVIAFIEKEQTKSLENKEVLSKKPIVQDLKIKINSEHTQVKKVTAPSAIIKPQVISVDKKIIPAKVKTTPAKGITKEIMNPKPFKVNSQATKKSTINKKALPEKIAPRQDNRSELEIVLETALNTDKLKEDLFIKNRNGYFQQLIIKTNNKFDDLIDVRFAGKKAIIISSRYSQSFNIVDDKFVDIQGLKIEEDKAILEFIYHSEFIQVELERIDDKWAHKYTGKSYAQEDHFVRQELLQMLLDNEEVAEVIKRSENGDSKPFILLSDGLLSDHLKVNFEGNDLEIVSYPNSLRESYVKITKFQVKKKKAVLEFIYRGITNVVNFRNKDNEWAVRSFKANGK